MLDVNHFEFGRTNARLLLPILLFFILLTYNEAINGAEVKSKEPLSIDGHLITQDEKPNISYNISGIASNGKILIIGADEGADVLVFNKHNTLGYTEAEHVCISLDNKSCGSERKGKEIDIEGIAWGKRYLYVIGSHSKARKSVKSDRSVKENQERLHTIKIEPTREQLFRIKLDDHGKPAQGSKIKQISLRNLLANHRLFSLFLAIPSKENGIDIEGLAVKEIDGEDRLYIGFRGPVLRGNHAIIMELEFEQGKFKENKILDNPEIHFLNLAGHGIRGMTELASGGLLLLAGPVGDALTTDEKSRYQLFFWDGKSSQFGTPLKPICDIPTATNSKAEGIELLNKGKTATEDYRFVVVYDGAQKGGATLFTCSP